MEKYCDDLELAREAFSHYAEVRKPKILGIRKSRSVAVKPLLGTFGDEYYGFLLVVNDPYSRHLDSILDDVALRLSLGKSDGSGEFFYKDRLFPVLLKEVSDDDPLLDW